MAELSIPELIRKAAVSRGVDPEVALRIAERESRLDPTAKNKRSSAYGLFQVTDDTWKQYGGDPAKRRDLGENLRVGLDVISSNRDTFIRQFGREPAPGELYTMHFLGRTGGPKLLRADPSLPVADVVSPRVLKANPEIKGKTVGEFIASMQQKMGAPKAPATAVATSEGNVPMPTAPKETMQRPQRPRLEPLAESPLTRDMLANLGPNYQAALAAVTLGDSRDDEEEESLSEQYAARQEEDEGVPRSAALAGLDLSYQSPFAEPVQQFKHGGIVHRADGSPRQGERAYEGTIFPYADEGQAKKALEEYTRLVANKESMQQFTPELLIRGETLRKQAMDPVSVRLARETALESPRYQGDPYLPRAITAKDPVTLFAGLPGAQVVDMAPLKDTTLGGFVFDRVAMEQARREGKHLSDVIFMAPPKSRRVQEILEMTPGQSATDRQLTLAHEAEHLLAKKGLVDPNKPNIEGPHPINTTFDTLVDSRTARGTFVRNVAGIKDYLTKKYDVHLPAYFSRSRPEEFHEQIATLSAIEQVKNVDLTQDPELRKTLFKDPTTRKAYRAITGLRQTRLDARDLPPYTMQPEPGETTASQGALDFIRSQLESTKEGLITAKDKFARMFKEGVPQQQQVRPLNKADGGYIDPYGMDTGPVTADTRKALSTRQGLSAAELMRMLKGVGREGVSNLESLARGSVSAVPGLVGDIESLFRSDKERRFATTPEVERQYLPQRMTAPTKESSGFVELGTFIDPTIAGRVARPVAQGTAKAMMAGVKAAGPQIEATLSKMAPAAQPLNVVKPTGGTTYPASMVSKIDDYLQRIERGVTSNSGETRPRIFEGNELKGKDAKKIIDFVNTKGRDYFTKRYGSPQDAMKEAILEGRVTLTGADAELFPPNLLAAAREGNPVALERFEEIYDKKTGLRGIVVADDFNRATGARGIALMEDLKPSKEAVAKQKEWEKLLKEGALPHEINLNIAGIPQKDLGYGYGSDAETELRKFLSGKKTPTKEASAVMYAAKQGEPIYDLDSMYPRLEYLEPDTVIPALASVVDDLDKMSFPEALIRGMQKTEVLRNDEAAISRAAQGKSVPVELFQRGIEPIAPIGDFSLVRVKSPFAVRMEGAAMRHSIGNYATNAEYGVGGKEAFESGSTQVFSIRNAQGKPIVSMDAEMIEGRPSFDQIRAAFNSEPNAQEKEAIFKAFDTFFPDIELEKLDIFLPAVRYKHTREGHNLPLNEQTRIDWWQEYTNYLRKKDAN